jgi:uncharacterized protein (TIGR02099 family)
MRRLRRIGKVLLYAAAGVIGVVLLAMLALKLALDRAPRYQAEIKEWVHAQTGYHIRFAHVAPAFRWYGPELYFDQLELRSKDDQRVLVQSAGGRIGADVWQLLHTGQLLAGRVELDAPAITLTRLGPQRFAIGADIELGGERAASEPFTLDDLPAGTLVIRNAVVTLVHWNETLPQLELRRVDVRLHRNEFGAGLVAAAQLPEALCGTVSLQGSLKGRGAVNMLPWNGTGRVRSLKLAGWHQLLPQYLSGLSAGSAGFDITVQGQGARFARADLALTAAGVETSLGDGTVARFDQMSADLALVRSGERWTLTGRHVRAARRDAESNIEVTWHQGEAGLLDLRAEASYLRAETLLPLAVLIPQPQVRERLNALAPTGEWSGTVFALTRASIDLPWQLEVHGKFRDAGFAPLGKAPGLRGLNGSLAGTEHGGHVFLDSTAAVFNWPAQLAQPVAVTAFTTQLYWRNAEDGLTVATSGWDLKTQDAEAHGKFAWQRPVEGDSPLLTLVSRIQNGNVAAARKYLPHALLPPNAFNWLDNAFLAGHLTRADAVLQGPVKHFPFRDGSGLFLVRCAIDSLNLNYSDNWPAADNVSGLAEFRNEGLSVRLQSGRIGEMHLESGEARFADFKTGELKLRINAAGDARGALAYLRATPLDAMAEHLFSTAQARGPMSASIDLFLPFKDFAHRHVLVRGHLDGAALTRVGFNTEITEAFGDFTLDGAQITQAELHGQLLGGGFQMQARTVHGRAPAARTQLEFRGTLRADALREALALPAAFNVTGTADWRAVLKIVPDPARERSLHISSTLAGFDVRLPAPLDKPAGTPLPASVDIQWPQNGAPLGRFALGSLLNGAYALAADGESVKLGHASLNFGAEEAAGDDGQILSVAGAVERLDLGGWLKLGGGEKGAKPLSYYLSHARLNVAELDYLGLAFRSVGIELTVGGNDGAMGIALRGPNVAGGIAIPGAAQAAQPWNLEFERLKFEVADADAGDGTTSGASAPREAAASPASVPALNFHAAQLIWGERHFGDVRARLTRLNDGVHLESLNVSAPTLTVAAQGDWRGPDAGISHIQGVLASSDVQGSLKALGYADVLQAKAGKMDFDLSWIGAPTAEALSLVGGHVQMALDKGQVTGLNPGAGRVLGLASLAALPRRLSLDFSDLTDKGLAFDSVRGTFSLREGNAFTEDVLLKGPAAEIGLIGRIGLKNKDYDQTAVVTGNVGSSLPLAGAAFLGGPVVGAAVLLFTQVFKQPLKGLARGYYRITGSWENPNVERIKSAEAAAATGEGN